MNKKIYKILVLATSPDTKGGISYVIKSYQTWPIWQKYQIRWLPTHIDKNMLIKVFYFFRALCYYLFSIFKYDLIHIHASEPVSIVRKLPFFIIARIFNKKTIIHFHSFSQLTTIEGKYSAIYRYIFTNANRVIVLSENWKKIVTDKFKNKDNITVLYNPCKEENQSSFIKKQILYAGVLNQRKGYIDLLRAFAPLSKEFPDWNLFFAGNGELDNAYKLANELQIADKVIFAGWVEGKSKDKVFMESSVFCLPSYAEGFPMAVLDAWSYGLPVITTPVGGLSDVLIPDQNALVFESGNIDELKKQLKRLIYDEELRCNLSNEAKKLASTIFSPININKQLDMLYLKILE